MIVMIRSDQHAGLAAFSIIILSHLPTVREPFGIQIAHGDDAGERLGEDVSEIAVAHASAANLRHLDPLAGRIGSKQARRYETGENGQPHPAPDGGFEKAAT